MTLTRWPRPLRLAPSAFTLAVALAAAVGSHPARAQAPAASSPAPAPGAEGTPAEGEGTGRVFDGYFATGILAFGIIFIVAKSARRG